MTESPFAWNRYTYAAIRLAGLLCCKQKASDSLLCFVVQSRFTQEAAKYPALAEHSASALD
jgi:hypothetical protein